MPLVLNVTDDVLYRYGFKGYGAARRGINNGVSAPLRSHLLKSCNSVAEAQEPLGLPSIRIQPAVPEFLSVHLGFEQINSHDSGFGSDKEHFSPIGPPPGENPERRPRSAAV